MKVLVQTSTSMKFCSSTEREQMSANVHELKSFKGAWSNMTMKKTGTSELLLLKLVLQTSESWASLIFSNCSAVFLFNKLSLHESEGVFVLKCGSHLKVFTLVVVLDLITFFISCLQVRNEPKNICVSAEYVSKIKGVSLEKVMEATTQNALQLFPKLKATIRLWLCPYFI